MEKLKRFLDNCKTLIATVVALLIVVPSVFNAVGDIWVAWNDLPIGEKQKVNASLFKAHYKDTPLYSKRISVNGSDGRSGMILDVYANGDVLIDYGRYTQWFPYNGTNGSVAQFQFIRSAHADNYQRENINKNTQTIKNEVGQNGEIIRIREFEDGSKERLIIDINTGKILKVEIVKNP